MHHGILHTRCYMCNLITYIPNPVQKLQHRHNNITKTMGKITTNPSKWWSSLEETTREAIFTRYQLSGIQPRLTPSELIYLAYQELSKSIK